MTAAFNSNSISYVLLLIKITNCYSLDVLELGQTILTALSTNTAFLDTSKG